MQLHHQEIVALCEGMRPSMIKNIVQGLIVKGNGKKVIAAFLLQHPEAITPKERGLLLQVR